MPQRNLREQILDRGGRAIYERGFHAASVSDIAAVADVPKGSVYNHFTSKEALAMEVLRRYGESFDLETLREGQGAPLTRLRAFFAETIEATVARGVEFGCLLGNMCVEMAGHDGPLAQQAAEMWERLCDACAEVLREAQAAGDLDQSLDPAVYGPWLVDAYEGAVSHAKLRRDRGPLDTFMIVIFDGPRALLG